MHTVPRACGLAFKGLKDVIELMKRLGLRTPIVQAPMAGVSTPAMAAAVTQAGGLGSIGLGASDVAGARALIEGVKALTDGSFNVNVFCHRPAQADHARELAWLGALRPVFERFDAEPPMAITEIYRSFVADADMLDLLLEMRPAVVSFHFGLPEVETIGRLKAAGIALFSTATNLAEAEIAVSAGADAIVAQGYEAGGHRGVFDPDAFDTALGVAPLTRLLVSRIAGPVIAAGGIMDGAGVAAMLNLGAEAAQLGTAFVPCPESTADDGYRAALFGEGASRTVMTRLISGRPARSIGNAFTSLGGELNEMVAPDYPITYDAGKRLNAAAKAKGESGFGAQWAGQGAPLARVMPTAELVATITTELELVLGRRATVLV